MNFYIIPSQAKISPSCLQDILDIIKNEIDNDTAKEIKEMLEEYKVQYE